MKKYFILALLGFILSISAPFISIIHTLYLFLGWFLGLEVQRLIQQLKKYNGNLSTLTIKDVLTSLYNILAGVIGLGLGIALLFLVKII